MLPAMIRKELLGILQSPKFTATFAACSALILLSVSVGIHQYRSAVREYESARQLVGQELREQTRWGALNNRTYRAPEPMQIFVAGVNNDVGRWSDISQFDPVKLRHSAYGDDPIFAIFRFIDLTFIVQIVLSLFAILFTYDAINGEREAGTLSLALANPVPRARLLIAKFAGSWLGLTVPLLLPAALSLLLLLVFRVPLDGTHWLKIISLAGVSALYFTFFVAFGLLISSLTRQSNLSFLLCLVGWITFILILPRAGVILASQAVPVPTVAEIEGQRDAYAKDRWEEHGKELERRLGARRAQTAGMTKEEREQYENDHLPSWTEEDDAKRKLVQKEIDDFGVRLQEDLRSRKGEQERLAFLFSRFSPASAYQLAAMEIAGTGIGLKSRYEDALRQYRDTFNRYTDRKQKESGDSGGIRVSVDSEKGISISMPRERGTLDLADKPEFTGPPQNPFRFPSVDAGILATGTLLAFAGCVAGFLRYDVRP